MKVFIHLGGGDCFVQEMPVLPRVGEELFIPTKESETPLRYVVMTVQHRFELQKGEQLAYDYGQLNCRRWVPTPATT